MKCSKKGSKPYLVFRIGRNWGKMDIIKYLCMLNGFPKSKSEMKRLWESKGLEFFLTDVEDITDIGILKK